MCEAELYTYKPNTCKQCGKFVGQNQELCWKCKQMNETVEAFGLVIEELNHEIEERIKNEQRIR